jgi:hypothetical protein
MELDFAILASAAEANNGKINLLGGGFDTVHAEDVPFSMPPFALVVRFTLDESESTEGHTIGVEMASPDGDVKGLLDDDGELPFARGSKKKQNAVGIIQIAFQFESFGKYEIRVLGDGEVVKTFELNVEQRTTKNAKEK